MKSFPAILAGSLIAVLALPHEAEAQSRAVVTTDLNMRAGPGTQFPVVNVLTGGRSVTVQGCVRDLSWCDVTTRTDRGWVSARYLAEEQRRRPIVELAPSIGLPMISFQFGDYWDRHYSGREFYRDRDRWRRDWDGPRRTRDADRRDWSRSDDRDRRWDGERDRRGDRIAPETTGSTIFEFRSESIEEAPRIEMRREDRGGGRRSEERGPRRWDGPPGHRDGHPGRGRGPRD
jgi:uncharacterized protein YraI